MSVAGLSCVLLIAALLPRNVANSAKACVDQEELLVGYGAQDFEVSLLQTGLVVHGSSSHLLAKLTFSEWMAETHPQSEKGSSLLQMDGIHMALYVAVGAALLLVIVLAAMFTGIVNSGRKDERLPDAAKPGGSMESTESQGSASGEREEKPKLWMVLFFVLGHSISASSLTVVNKLAMEKFHQPFSNGVLDNGKPHGYVWTLVLIQFLVAAIVARLAGATGLVKVDPLQWRPALKYFPAAGMFMITIVAGNAVMNYTNVNTFLILRALVPVPCAVLETLLYADPYPPRLSWVALAITIGGACLYTSSVGGFEMRSIAWAAIFLTAMPIDGILIKHAISQSRLTAWGLVYYNNILAAAPLVVYVLIFEVTSMQAFHTMMHALMLPEARQGVLISSFVGVSISFFQLNTRYYISATAFMILGVVNKFLTVAWSEIFLGFKGFKPLLGIVLALVGAICWQVIMGQSSMKLRERNAAWDKQAMLPFALTLGALAWAAWIQHMVPE